MIYYYLITTILTFLSLVILIFAFEIKKVNYYFMFLFLLMTLANGGYLSIALSTTVTEAVLANKICYLGGCFLPPITLFLICAICNYKIPFWLRWLLYSYSFLVYAMVLTIGFNNFYYTGFYLEKYDNATVLGHTYGIGHSFYYVILYGYIIAQIILLLYSILKKKVVSRRNLWALITMVTVNISLFILGRAINPAIEIMPLAYVIDSWIFLYMYRRGSMYNVADNIAASFKKQETHGYIMFDNHLNYLGCNSIAMHIFPSLADCIVDHQLENTAALETIHTWLQHYTKNIDESFSYENGDAHYECHIERIWYRQKARGYMLELREDTDKWKYLHLLSSYNSELEHTVNEQTHELRIQKQRVQELFIQTITALSEAVDAKDRYTSGHSKRVAEYARMIAERLGKSKDEQDKIYHAGLLHDVGKIRISADIINKPGKLTDEEYNTIKIHPVTGYHILNGISDDSYIAIAAKYHHERYDGKGYPNGISGNCIPEVARILAVADSYDAMASNRSYRNALPQEVVQNEIEKGKGTQFDPFIADIMLQMIAEDKEYALKQTDSMHRKVLTIDDDDSNNKRIEAIMQDEPVYEIISASSGKEALDILSHEMFDLILLDVEMPEMNGFETLRCIKEKYRIPVVLMTGDKTLDITAEIYGYRCDDYITKPLIPLLVKEVIHNMTERTDLKH